MPDALQVRALSRDEFERHIPDLAKLRIEVFRQWPYLYDGDLAYEKKYLQTYIDAEGTFIAGAFSNSEIVGASTAMPLMQHEAAFIAPLQKAGFDVERIFYFGESVLRAQYRGQGAGVAFFDMREEEARRQGFATCVFSAVERRTEHPLRPKDYMPLDAFWQRRGYEKIAGAQASYAWKDVGDETETEKPMAYWIKRLS